MSNNLKKLREACGLTQVELAKRIHVSQQAVVKWENGESMPRASKLVELAQIYSCTVDELLKGKQSA